MMADFFRMISRPAVRHSPPAVVAETPPPLRSMRTSSRTASDAAMVSSGWSAASSGSEGVRLSPG